MARRKSDTYQKLNAVPRKPGEQLVKTTVMVTETHAAWMKAHGGPAEAIRGLIDAAQAIEALGQRPPAEEKVSQPFFIQKLNPPAEVIAERRRTVLEVVGEFEVRNEPKPSLTKVRKGLAARGIVVSNGTVYGDMKALGLY